MLAIHNDNVCIVYWLFYLMGSNILMENREMIENYKTNRIISIQSTFYGCIGMVLYL